MGLKKELDFLGKQLEQAKKAAEKNPPDWKTAEVNVDGGFKAITNALKVYEAKKKKSQEPLKKAKDNLKKLMGIVEGGKTDSAKMLQLLKEATNATNAAEKVTKAE